MEEQGTFEEACEAYEIFLGTITLEVMTLAVYAAYLMIT